MFIKNKIRPVFKNGRFFNYPQEPREGLKWYLYMFNSLLHEVYIFLTSIKNGKSRIPNNFDAWIEKPKIFPFSKEPIITWIGHASFLIQVGNVNILTDPIFGDLTFLFPRILPPGISIDNLPKIDYVIISHNHLDHMDAKSLYALINNNPDLKICVPYGDKLWFANRKFKNVFESLWWQEHKFETMIRQQSIIFTFLPSHHWSQRGIFDQNKSLWGSWMIECGGQKIYFAGDTAYSNHFSIISDTFEKIDIALMPIGPCEPRHKMSHTHTDANDAGRAFLDLKAKHFIPMHWGTFHFGTDDFATPINKIKLWWQSNQDLLNDKFLHVLKFGQSIRFDLPEISRPISKPTIETTYL